MAARHDPRMQIRGFKTSGPRRPKGKAPRVSISIEPTTAHNFRQLAKQERMELSTLLAQALIAWLKKWRPEYELRFEGPEGPVDEETDGGK